MTTTMRNNPNISAPGMNAVLPQIHLFDDDNFRGDELDIFGEGTPAIGRDAGKGWNDDVSSVVVVSGTWELFTDNDFQDRKLTLVPGTYPSIEACGMGNVGGATAEPPGPGWNDKLSSLRVKAW